MLSAVVCKFRRFMSTICILSRLAYIYNRQPTTHCIVCLRKSTFGGNQKLLFSWLQ
ncbi:putative ras-like guanine nucleotide exchange factor [Plasmopara halstedii]